MANKQEVEQLIIDKAHDLLDQATPDAENATLLATAYSRLRSQNPPGATLISGVDTGIADAYLINAPGYVGYTNTDLVLFQASHANTGASTLSINSLIAKPLKKKSGTSFVDLASGDIIENEMIYCAYNGEFFQVLIGA